MAADLVVVGAESFEDAAQVRLAEHRDMVEAFASERSDEPLDMSVLSARSESKSEKLVCRYCGNSPRRQALRPLCKSSRACCHDQVNCRSRSLAYAFPTAKREVS